MNLSQEIELDYLEAGADKDLARFVKKLISTYAKDAENLCSQLPMTLERLSNSSPLDDVQLLSEILDVLPSASQAPDNFVLYRALCKVVAIKLPGNTFDQLLNLANAIASQDNSSQKSGNGLVVEALIGSLGSLHPAASQKRAVKIFLNSPLLVVDYPEALGELSVRSQNLKTG